MPGTGARKLDDNPESTGVTIRLDGWFILVSPFFPYIPFKIGTDTDCGIVDWLNCCYPSANPPSSHLAAKVTTGGGKVVTPVNN
jgi:hypothetical protein